MRARYLVSGRVQGVGFRMFVYRSATGIGLRGYCRNLPDGRVEVVAEGDETGLQTLEAALKRGPRLASVSTVDKAEILDQMTAFKTFEII